MKITATVTVPTCAGLACLAFASVAYAQSTTSSPTGSSEQAVIELEKFIVEESMSEGADTLMQTARPVDSVFLGALTTMEIPRSVTVLTPESMKQLFIKGFEDLDRAGAGLTRPNIFGIPGLPFIRGDNAGVYFSGMRRIPNQNETPTSFGSLDAMDLVKGPAPAQFGPTNGGGYVNFMPKAPYFDKFRGSVQFTIGSYEHFNTQIDVGGPLLFLDRPMAYRVSITNQQAQSYYNAVKNDYISVYASAKMRLSPTATFYTGGEYYNFKSNENAGWNRVTQDLIDNGNYIYGEMDPNTVSPILDGTANPALITNQVDIAFSTGYDPNLAIVVPFADFQSRYGAPTGANGAYTAGAAAAATPIFHQGSLFGYKYTPGYFTAGGELFTKKIEGNQVLSDPSDYANSETALWFADLVLERGEGRTVSIKTFVEWIKTRKLSSYGFAHDSDSYALEEKLAFDDKLTIGGTQVDVQYGGDLRYTYNNDANDFGVEPFNRRDVSSSDIPPWSVVYVGPQYNWNPASVGLPAGFVGGSRSTLFQAGLFGQFHARFGESFSLFGGARVERADFSMRTPKEFANQAPKTSDDKSYGSISLNPVLRITEQVSLYAALQQGTVLQPAQTGGVNNGRRNFMEAPFYEGGVKLNLLGGRVFASAAVYEFEKETLANIPTGGVDSERYKAKGYELELSIAPTPSFYIVGSVGKQESKYVNRFPFTTRPYTPEQVALYSGSIQYGPFGLGPGNTSRYGNNLEGERAGYPQLAANLFAVYTFSNGFGFGVGPTYKEAFWLDNEHTLRLPSAVVWNANLFYRKPKFEFFLRLSNVTDEDYFIGASFAPTMIVTKAKPFEAMATATLKF